MQTQIVRHRSFSQSLGQRYADPAEFGEQFVTREARLQDKKNRQNSIGIDSESDLHYEWQMKQQKVIDVAKETYEWAFTSWYCPRTSPVVHQKATPKTRLYMNGTLRSWVHYTSNCVVQMVHKKSIWTLSMLVQKL